MARAERVAGFRVLIRPRPDVTDDQARRLLRALEDYFAARGLEAEGTQLLWHVRSSRRQLTATDAVNLLDWLVDLPVVSEVQLRLGAPRGGNATPPVCVRVDDPATSGLTLLYRLRRLSASQYLGILAGAADAKSP